MCSVDMGLIDGSMAENQNLRFQDLRPGGGPDQRAQGLVLENAGILVWGGRGFGVPPSQLFLVNEGQ